MTDDDMKELLEPVPTAYQRIVDTVTFKVREQLAAGKDLRPTAYILNLEKNVFVPMLAEFPNDKAKDLFAQTLRKMSASNEAQAVLMVSEAWALPPDMEKPGVAEELIKKFGSISQVPGRIEVVWMVLETYEGNWMCRATIKREPNSKSGRIDTELSWFRADNIAGRFANFLPPKVLTLDAFREALRAALIRAGINPQAQLNHTSTPIIDLITRSLKAAPPDALTHYAVLGMVQKTQELAKAAGWKDTPPAASENVA